MFCFGQWSAWIRHCILAWDYQPVENTLDAANTCVHPVPAGYFGRGDDNRPRSRKPLFNFWPSQRRTVLRRWFYGVEIHCCPQPQGSHFKLRPCSKVASLACTLLSAYNQRSGFMSKLIRVRDTPGFDHPECGPGQRQGARRFDDRTCQCRGGIHPVEHAYRPMKKAGWAQRGIER